MTLKTQTIIPPVLKSSPKQLLTIGAILVTVSAPLPDEFFIIRWTNYVMKRIINIMSLNEENK